MSVDLTVAHDHGILVIEDAQSRADHSEWDVTIDGAHFEPDSLYVAVLPTIEGTVSTSIRVLPDDGADPVADDLRLAIKCSLQVPNRVLVLGDSDRNVEVRLPAPSRAVEVAVYVNEMDFASKALVILCEPTKASDWSSPPGR